MNILITGGAGFIGSNLSKSLVGKGHVVTVLDNLSPQIHGDDGENSELYKSIRDIVIFIKGDVRNIKDWNQALKGQDAVIHLAAETGTGQSMYEICRYVNVNVGGTGFLLDYLTNQSHTIKKVIVASSRAIYGEGRYLNEYGYVYPNSRLEDDLDCGDFECKCPIGGGGLDLVATDENSKIHPTSIYGITKYNQEQMVLTTCKSLAISALAFRYQNVYGPGQSLNNPYTGILSIFSNQLLQGNDLNIFEDGKESRDFVYIDDVITATVLGVEANGLPSGAYNVGSGRAIDVLTVAQILKDNYQSKCNLEVTGSYRFGDIRHNYADLKKIERDLGFKTLTKFRDGVRNFCDWVLEQQTLLDNRYDHSLHEMRQRGLLK